MESQARIELYVPERAVARHEAAFQRWVETVTAPLRYVCVGDNEKTRFCDAPLGKYIKDFGMKKDDAPRRKGMSAFSGFSMARDQYGVWFRDDTGAPDEDRNTIYTFLVDGELGEVAYYAIRERLARKILRDRNEQAVLLSRTLDSQRGLEKELVYGTESAYREFAEAFASAAKRISLLRPARIDLAWKLLHLFQLLQRDLIAAANESDQSLDEILPPLSRSFPAIVEGVFEGRILERMSSSVLSTWVRIATKLARRGCEQAVPAVISYVERVIKTPILDIADSLWRFQGHSFAGARDLECDSCGVEAFAFVAGLSTSLEELDRSDLFDNRHAQELQRLWTDPTYIPHLLLRDWRGLSYALNARNRKDLAAAFGLRTVDSIARSGISDERSWYHGIMRGVFPNE